MSYPQPPATRLPYDADGTRVLVSRSAAEISYPVQIPLNAISAMNADIGGGLLLDGETDWSFGTSRTDFYTRPFIALMFPWPTTIKGWSLSALSSWIPPTSLGFPQDGRMANLTVRLQASTDSTNGIDGTWTTVGTKDEGDRHLPYIIENLNFEGVEVPGVDVDGNVTIGGNWSDSNSLAAYRFGAYHTFQMQYDDGPIGWGIEDLDLSGLVALRLYFPERPRYIDTWQGNSGIMDSWLGSALINLHLYGYPTAPDDGLTLRNVADTGLADFWFGDVDHNVPVVQSFRVKNLSSADAQQVVVSIQPDDSHLQTSPESLALSIDGETWAPKISLGDISAGGISDEMHIRMLAHPSTVGRRSALVVARAGRWI